MTEKRSDYQKKIKNQKSNVIFDSVKSAFNNDEDVVDVNPDFMRSTQFNSKRVNNSHQKREQRQSNNAQEYLKKEDKALKLKNKLNLAIFIVLVLIVLVLLALFHL
ncbi:hypothetical protein [Lactobacillus bombicola]|uniref:hypothetical protein n=1 Tax=Lactobacillus bombicola TaxID=1505723 RepID=UPI000E5781AF|nr:hypothetical protein [Lactobacillus bombicola]RHW50436.1 hypothetical protein DS833_03950 [Lactobacillus bombicola]